MILCCGEALIDMIPAETKLGPDGFVPHAGGAIFNTAIALGRLGTKSAMLTGLSTDMFGTQLESALQASNVDTSLIVRSDRHSTLAFVQLNGGHATYSFFDEDSAGRMLIPSDIPKLPSEVDALYFGGISLACEPGADTYADLAVQNGTEKLVMLDPNIRPDFIESASRYRKRLARMISVSDIVKVSDEDLEWILPEANTFDQKVKKILDAGPSIVVVTFGADGAKGFTASGMEVIAKSAPVDVVDTVGAGDTFNAGFLAKLSELGLLGKPAVAQISDKHLYAALEMGARIAAITVSRAGANPPWANEL